MLWEAIAAMRTRSRFALLLLLAALLLAAGPAPAAKKVGAQPPKKSLAHDGKAQQVWANEHRKRWRKQLKNKKRSFRFSIQTADR